ncbi:M20 family metallopeptidase [Chakrabartyella piscis]|uniref:M20 metallopeptidase family protein n=1 Tax=Chakrabartyella piscis TaxID=2918914 RepID=UPI002958A5E5|nr:M20 family metallopeptidase [Chakrabartyella piscis]
MKTFIANMASELKTLRRELHKIPESGLKEYKTTDFIEKTLASYGVTDVKRVLETGVVARIKGQDKKPTVAFRADIDALSVEEPEKEYASTHKGMMHACGHDGHTTILLGFAKYLMSLEEPPLGDVVLIFQPAEEGPGGAELLVKAGVLEEYGITKIIGCHMFPDVEQGKIACKSGALMARNGEVYIKIYGKSAHGAQPQLGADAIVAAGAVIGAVQSILARNVSPLDSGVLTLGKISGGEACNIIAKEVAIDGTMRAFSDEAYEIMTKRLEEVVSSVAAAYGCVGEVEFNHMYRVVMNDKELVDILEDVAGDCYQESPAYMLAEDFSFYQQEIPGIFFFVGTRNEDLGFVCPLHNAGFDFDENVLCLAVEIYAGMLEQM